MSCHTAKRYLALAKLYGWPVSWQGLFAFADQLDLRERWAG